MKNILLLATFFNSFLPIFGQEGELDLRKIQKHHEKQLKRDLFQLDTIILNLNYAVKSKYIVETTTVLSYFVHTNTMESYAGNDMFFNFEGIILEDSTYLVFFFYQYDQIKQKNDSRKISDILVMDKVTGQFKISYHFDNRNFVGYSIYEYIENNVFEYLEIGRTNEFKEIEFDRPFTFFMYDYKKLDTIKNYSGIYSRMCQPFFIFRSMREGYSLLD